jgi:hypothetical protein
MPPFRLEKEGVFETVKYDAEVTVPGGSALLTFNVPSGHLAEKVKLLLQIHYECSRAKELAEKERELAVNRAKELEGKVEEQARTIQGMKARREMEQKADRGQSTARGK